MFRDKNYGIVFSGGGALGAWEVGCYDAIRGRHSGSPPVIVTGASAGAINAAGVCAGMLAPQLEELWSSIKQPDVYQSHFSGWRKSSAIWYVTRYGLLDGAQRILSKYRSLYDTRALENTLRKKLGDYFNYFTQSPMHFAASVSNLNRGKREYFYKVPPNAEEPRRAQENDEVWTRVGGFELLLAALVGSTALPVLFPPRGEYFDGGVLLNQPITPVLALREPDVLYVVIPTPKALGKTNDILQIGQTLLTTWISASLVSQLDKLKLVNKMRAYRTDQGKPDIRLPICVIRPKHDLTVECGVTLLSFGCKVTELVSDGREAARAKLDNFNENESTWYDT